MTSTVWTFGWSWGAGIAGLLALAACAWLVWRNIRINPGHVAHRRLYFAAGALPFGTAELIELDLPVVVGADVF